MRLVFSSVFERDFAEIVRHLAKEASEQIGARFEAQTYATIKALLRQPEMGRLRQDLKPDGIRSFRIRRFERYLLFYQVSGDDLILLRLRYGGMDLRALSSSWE